jgi:glycosyltransferase involved in cell wall biosynthesis
VHLVVVSYKACWNDPESQTGFSTDGGFPFQMAAIAECFDETALILPVDPRPSTRGLSHLSGKNMHVKPLNSPAGQDLIRKLQIPFWLAQNGARIYKSIKEADVVHAPLPGDIGVIGLLIALYQGKPVFVRHCGTWGNTSTLANRFVTWFLPRIANDKNVVLATGAGDTPPSQENPNIQWIFSTSFTEKEWQTLPQANAWKPGGTLRLINVGRLSHGKNTASVIRAIPAVMKTCPRVHLDIAGDGPAMNDLKQIARKEGVADRVAFHGNLPHENVMELLSGCHLFVFPTNVKEGFPKGFPKAVIEAMACGLPVIATNVSVIPYLIGESCGIVIDKTDPATVAKAIEEIISDEDKLARMGRNARDTSREYTLERWQAVIRERLEAAWGPLKKEG